MSEELTARFVDCFIDDEEGQEELVQMYESHPQDVVDIINTGFGDYELVLRAVQDGYKINVNIRRYIYYDNHLVTLENVQRLITAYADQKFIELDAFVAILDNVRPDDDLSPILELVPHVVPGDSPAYVIDPSAKSYLLSYIQDNNMSVVLEILQELGMQIE